MLTPFNAFVEANEPGALHYELFRQMNGDTEVLVYLEVYVERLVSPSSAVPFSLRFCYVHHA